MNTVVVGLSQSRASRRALEWAARRAVDTGASLHVVTAFSDPMPIGSLAGGPVAFFDLDSHRRRVDQWQQSVVAAMSVELDTTPEIELWVRVGSALRVLRESAAGADLLVLGSSRRRYSRTIRRCITTAACPVFVVGLEFS